MKGHRMEAVWKIDGSAKCECGHVMTVNVHYETDVYEALLRLHDRHLAEVADNVKPIEGE